MAEARPKTACRVFTSASDLIARGSACVTQGVDDQALDILHVRIPKVQCPYPVLPVGGGLPASSRPRQQIILGTMAVQQVLDFGQQPAWYGNKPCPIAFRQCLDQAKVGIDRLAAQDVDPVTVQIHITAPQSQSLADAQSRIREHLDSPVVRHPGLGYRIDVDPTVFHHHIQDRAQHDLADRMD